MCSRNSCYTRITGRQCSGHEDVWNERKFEDSFAFISLFLIEDLDKYLEFGNYFDRVKRREKELKKFDDCVYIIMLFEFLSCNYWNDRDRRSRGKIILKFQIKTCSCHIVDAEDIETRFI